MINTFIGSPLWVLSVSPGDEDMGKPASGERPQSASWAGVCIRSKSTSHTHAQDWEKNSETPDSGRRCQDKIAVRTASAIKVTQREHLTHLHTTSK